MSILLVEDDIELARSLIERFQEHGYSVSHRCNGETGLKEARSREYGVIVLDRMLPGMSGLDLVKALRHEARMTPVIYLTTMGGIDDRVQDWRRAETITWSALLPSRNSWHASGWPTGGLRMPPRA